MFFYYLQGPVVGAESGVHHGGTKQCGERQGSMVSGQSEPSAQAKGLQPAVKKSEIFQ